MDIAILLFDRFTALDAVEPCEVLSRLPGARVVFVAAHGGSVAAETGGLRLVADTPLGQLPRPGILLAPGGPGQTAQMADGPVGGVHCCSPRARRAWMRPAWRAGRMPASRAARQVRMRAAVSSAGDTPMVVTPV